MEELKDLIVDHQSNKDNLSSLVSSFRKDTFVPFVGAGPSKVLGAADWPELPDKVSKSCDLKHFRKVKGSDGEIDFPHTFSKMFKKVQAHGMSAEEFYRKIFECIRPTTTTATWQHLQLFKLFNACITTNYDSPLEAAFEESYKKPATRYFFSCYGLSNFKDCIVYLHGHKDINFCIIKAEDYMYFYPSVSGQNGIPIIEDFLGEIFSKRHVIFVGTSFDDPFIGKYLAYLYAKKAPPKDPKESLPDNPKEPLPEGHYWLLNESAGFFARVKKKTSEYESVGEHAKATAEEAKFYDGQMNIRPIVYKREQHIFIEKLFQKLQPTLPGELDGTVVK